jgi:hypothetical protein
VSVVVRVGVTGLAGGVVVVRRVVAGFVEGREVPPPTMPPPVIPPGSC